MARRAGITNIWNRSMAISMIPAAPETTRTIRESGIDSGNMIPNNFRFLFQSLDMIQ